MSRKEGSEVSCLVQFPNNQEAALSARMIITRNGRFPSGIISLADEIGIYKNAIAPQYKELMASGVLMKVKKPTELNGQEDKVLTLNTTELSKFLLRADGHEGHTKLNHGTIIERFISGIYINTRWRCEEKNIEQKSQRLTQQNILLLILLLSQSNANGEIDNLSQAETRRFLGFTEAQLKSQFSKLTSMGLLYRVVPGGVFNSKRVKSKLKLDIVKLDKISRQNFALTPTYHTRNIVFIDWLKFVIDRLFINHFASEKVEVCAALMEIHKIVPMDNYPQALDKIVPLEYKKFNRYRIYLVQLCLKYAADIIMKTSSMSSNFESLVFSDEMNVDIVDNSESLDQQIINGLIKDLNIDNVDSDEVLKYKIRAKSKNNGSQNKSAEKIEIDDSQMIKLQTASLLKTLKSLTWALAKEVYEGLINNDNLNSDAYQIHLRLARETSNSPKKDHTYRVVVKQFSLTKQKL